MKRILKLAAAVLIIAIGSSSTKVSAQDYDDYDDYRYDEDRDVSYQTFYDELSPYGRWIDYPGLGYVWAPDAGPDFRPYSSNGRWVWTDDYDWMWVSDYDWGWAPFHYGRWEYDSYYGWFWVPGYEWSPAWVAWRDGGDYYGWAPLRPGINVSVNFNIGGYSPPFNYWSFAPRRFITSRNIFNHCIDYRRNASIINQTVIINNFNYNRNVFRTGPRRYDAERYIGRIEPVRFREANRPGRSQFRNNEVSVYRPAIRRNEGQRFVPRRVERFEQNNTNGQQTDNNRFRRTENDNRNFRINRELDQRNNNDIRQPGNNDQRRNFERNRISRQPSAENNEQRNFRVDERKSRNFEQNRNEGRRFDQRNNSNGNRVFERRPENNNSVQQRSERNDSRQQRRPNIQIPERRQEQPGQFERRGNNSGESGQRKNGGERGRNRF
jgi:hypothetical protein